MIIINKFAKKDENGNFIQLPAKDANNNDILAYSFGEHSKEANKLLDEALAEMNDTMCEIEIFVPNKDNADRMIENNYSPFGKEMIAEYLLANAQ